MKRYVIVLHVETDDLGDPSAWPWSEWIGRHVFDVSTFYPHELPADVHITDREIYEHE
jgi:hypothetical protein